MNILREFQRVLLVTVSRRGYRCNIRIYCRCIADLIFRQNVQIGYPNGLKGTNLLNLHCCYLASFETEYLY